MKSSTVVFGLFAGLTSAAIHHPRHLHGSYFARRNESSVAAVPSTTLTVEITSTHTITSCAPTITGCPAHAGNSTGPVTVTEIIDLTTIVCPVTDATSISSSVTGDYSSGLITGSTHIVTTTDNSPAQTPAPSSGAGVSSYPTVSTADATLTMTLGPDGSQSVTVTTIHSTYTEMVTVTAVPYPTSSSDNSGSGSDGDVTSSEGTTTTTITSTSTRTVYVPGTTSTATVIGTSTGSPDVTGEAICTPVTVTVTEAAPASTVYITVSDYLPNQPTAGGIKVPTTTAVVTPTASASYPVGTGGSGSGNGNGNGNGNGGNDDEDDTCEDDAADDEEECAPEETTSEADVTVTATATVVPYPTGSANGTIPTGHPVGTGSPVVRRHPLY